ARRFLGSKPFLPALQARCRRHAQTIPQVGKNLIKRRKPLQEPGPASPLPFSQDRVRVARASPAAMTGRTDLHAPAWQKPNPKESARANVNKWMIDPGDAVLLLIDHQSGLFQLVKDIELPVLRSNVTALAKMAHLAKIPTITTASVPDGPNGPLIPEIQH